MNKKTYTFDFLVVLGSLYFFSSYLMYSFTSILEKVFPSYSFEATCGCSSFGFFSSIVISTLGFIFFVVLSWLLFKRYAEYFEGDEYVHQLNHVAKVLFFAFSAYILYYPLSFIVSGGSFSSFSANLACQVLVLFVTGFFLFAKGKGRGLHAMIALWSVQALLLVIMYAIGFMIFGTPLEQYRVSADASTLTRLRSTANAVDDYIYNQRAFPNSLKDVVNATSTYKGEITFKHPTSNQYFDFTHKEDKENSYGDKSGTYKLCSTMYLDYKTSYDLTENVDFLSAKNKAGEYCVTRSYSIFSNKYDGYDDKDIPAYETSASSSEEYY